MPIQSNRIASTYSDLTTPQQRALLVVLRRSGQPRSGLRWRVSELEALAREVGVEVVYETVQTYSEVAGRPLFGAGRLRELAELCGNGEVRDGLPLRSALPRAPDLVLVDAVLSSAQQRSLVRALEVPVVDRSELILRLFALRARTREARLTVQISALRHALPRLREASPKHERGGGGRGDRGNTEHALQRERTEARIAALEQELRQAQRMTRAQEMRRSVLPKVALAGYTNAGTSSWLSALTGKDTLIADKPFATLATTVRCLSRKSAAPEPLLVSDTVGFLRDLPHELVPSFHATLREIRDAGLCLCVADASDPHVREQIEVTQRTLEAIGAGDVPQQWLLNKADRVAPGVRAQLALEYPEALQVSALEPGDVGRVRQLIARHFEVPE
jgi:GTP-binding protein HflX